MTLRTLRWLPALTSGPIAVRDLAIQEREDDLILATFGRSFWILEAAAALENRIRELGGLLLPGGGGQ
ncbi:MAG: hypothetical protein PVJ04_04080 [Gemmatimonadota bacterium]|jgi:hypothetical protein